MTIFFPNNYPKTILFCLGCLSALAMAPVYFWPLMMGGYIYLVLSLSQTEKPIKAAANAFLFFFGFFLTSLYWISSSLFVDFDRWWWALPFSFVGLPILLAVFPAFFCFIAAFVNKRHYKMALMAVALIVTDFARGHLFTGFPWNLPVHTWAHTDLMMSTLPYIGFWGLNTLTIVMFCLPLLIKNKMVIGVYIIGLIGISLITVPQKNTSLNINLSMIQANIPQQEKWNPELIQRNFDRYISLSQEAIQQHQSDIIVWPETAISQLLLLNPKINRQMSDFLKTLPSNGILITGYLNFIDNKPRNSIIALNRDGEIVAQYDKHHLVPFGEYMPFGLETLTSFYNFDVGSGPRTILIPDTELSFSPAICYESIFPEYFSHTTESSMILILTNDAWFGDTAGPYQHFDHTLFRAAENGVSALRLSGNGISSFIDKNGKPLALTHLNEMTVLSNNH